MDGRAYVVQEKEGGDRLGRYPFLAVANEYVKKREKFLKASTVKTKKRIYRELNEMLTDMKREKRISTLDPGKFSEDDIGSILIQLRQMNLENSTIIKRLNLVNQLCQYRNNNVIVQLRNRKEQLPRPVDNDIKSLEIDEINKILSTTKQIQGWEGAVCRFIVVMLFSTGLRPGELRQANISDLDTKKMALHVRVPKGNGTWGKKRDAGILPILPDVKNEIRSFILIRDKRLKQKGYQTDGPLIPAIKRDSVSYYTESGFRRFTKIIKEQLKKNPETIDLDFSLKTFRASFAGANLGKDPKTLPLVAHLLGHASTNTTQKYYARIKSSDAIEMMEKIWLSPTPDAESLDIDDKFDMTSYA